MTVPLARLRVGLAALGVIFCVAVCGYRLAGWDWLDAIYMVVITMSTVGFREVGPMTPGLKLFTILVIVFGVSTSFYILGGLVHMVLEGEINRALGMRRVSREIERLSGHVVICGFGRMGEVVAGELAQRKRPFAVIDSDAERIAEAIALGYLALQDDATEEATLRAARVPEAEALITTLPSDADNVFITLTSRDLNPRLQIIARGEHRSTEKKLIRAGADRVVLPAMTGALRMAAMITRPSVIELVELAAGGQIAEMAIEELAISADCRLLGKSIRDSQARNHHGLLIVALRRADGQLVLNPGASTEFQAGDTAVVIGRLSDIEKFRGEYGI
jgi:voltage-gated potassium channel